MQNKFDLICIGGGSGGIACANKAAEFGAKCAVVEAKALGGTCVNLGCVPKKVMWAASNLAEHFRQDAKAYGFQIDHLEHNWQQLVTNRQNYIRRLHKIYADKFAKNNVTHISGSASFIDKNTIQVNDKTYQAKHIVIATGGRPLIPEFTGADLGISSDDFFSLTECPKKVAVIGGGYIGAELACLLNGFGTDVSLILRAERPLRHFDEDLGSTLTDIMKQQGISIYCYHQGNALIKKHDKLELHCVDKKPITGFDQVIWAIGRRPNIEALNLDKIAIKCNDQNYIITDKFQNTNMENIYAVGDVADRIQLTPVAIAAGRRLATRLFGNDPQAYLDYENIPTVIFTHPPVAAVGLSEQEAKEKFGADTINVYQSKFNPMFYALSEHKIPTLMKLVTQGKEEKIVGCHIIGRGADEILQGFAVAIKMGACKKDFDNTVAIHPTSAETLVTMKRINLLKT